MVPSLVLAMAVCTLSLVVWAFVAVMVFMSAFATLLFPFAVCGSMRIATALVALCDVQLGCVPFSGVTEIVDEKTHSDALVGCLGIVRKYHDGLMCWGSGV